MRRLLLLLLLVPLLGACGGGSTTSRASGVAERWLQAVSDTGRPSVAEDATQKAERYGSVEAAEPLLRRATFEEDESLFTDLEVGAAEGGRVPLRVTRRLEGGEKDEVFATAVLTRDGDDAWRVVELDDPRPDELVPSKGGERPASATARHWLAAVAVGALLAVASALVIEAQPAVRQQARPGYVPAAPQQP